MVSWTGLWGLGETNRPSVGELLTSELEHTRQIEMAPTVGLSTGLPRTYMQTKLNTCMYTCTLMQVDSTLHTYSTYL